MKTMPILGHTYDGNNKSHQRQLSNIVATGLMIYSVQANYKKFCTCSMQANRFPATLAELDKVALLPTQYVMSGN